MSFKRKSKFGKWIDEQKGVNTFELVRVSKLSKSTILKLCYDQDYRPRFSTIIKINQGLKNLVRKLILTSFFSDSNVEMVIQRGITKNILGGKLCFKISEYQV